MATSLGVASNTISRWETGTYKISVEDLCGLARVFEIPVAEMIPGREVGRGPAGSAAEMPPTARAEHRRAMVGHAVTLLNNHLPKYGDRPYRPDPAEDADKWKQDGAVPSLYMECVPGGVRDALADALAEAARLVAAEFRAAGILG